MSPVQRGAAVLGTLAMVVGAPRAALAVPADEHAVRLEYVAHEGCPDALGFFWYVRARTQHVRLAVEGEPADLAKIHIARSGERSVGTLELPPFEGRPFSREVEAPNCADVVLALSLVVALAYDPDATTTFPSTVTAPPAPEAPVPAPSPSPQPVVAPPPVQQDEAPRETKSPEHRERHGAAAGFGVLGSGGVGPTLQLLLAPFVEYAAKPTGLWQPRVRAAFLVQVPSANVSVAGVGSATVQLFAGQLEGCPISVPLNADVSIVPCIGIDAGRLLGRASSGVAGALNGGLWRIALDGTVRLRSALAGPLFAELTATGSINLDRGKFVFIDSSGKDVEVYKLPDLFGSFGVGLGVHFP